MSTQKSKTLIALWKTKLGGKQDPTKRIINLREAIDFFTGSDTYHLLIKSPALFFRICILVFKALRDNLKFGSKSLWNKLVKDISPRYFFDSMPFVLELEELRFQAYRSVFP